MAKKVVTMYENRKRERYGIEGNVIKKPTVKKSTEKKSNIHSGHRERLRERFLKEGLDNFQDHNALELLLFYAIPQKDTNEEAHRLIDTFGSLSEVFDASYDELCNVKGIGPRTATLIKIMPELFRKYEVDKLNKDAVFLNDSELAAEYACKFFKGITEEKLYLICLDSRCRLISFDLMSEGTIKSTPLNARLIIETAFKNKATSLILVHNHPTGITAPSKADVDATANLAYVLKQSGLRLDDHIIVGHGNDYFSFRKSKKYQDMF